MNLLGLPRGPDPQSRDQEKDQAIDPRTPSVGWKRVESGDGPEDQRSQRRSERARCKGNIADVETRGEQYDQEAHGGEATGKNRSYEEVKNGAPHRLFREFPAKTTEQATAALAENTLFARGASQQLLSHFIFGVPFEDFVIELDGVALAADRFVDLGEVEFEV